MRRVEKEAEPECLEELRQTPGADWSSVTGNDKQILREHAWTEQHGLCAYCMSRLPAPSADGMKIEHFVSRAEDKALWFAWSNLLGVCLGDIGIEGPTGQFHCDTHRGHLPVEKQRLHVHPARFPPDAGSLFSYTDAGEIRPAQHLDGEDRARVDETIGKLNLNIARLKRNRAEVRKKAREVLRDGKVTPRRVMELLANAKLADPSGRLAEYCEVAVQYFEKKLRQV